MSIKYTCTIYFKLNTDKNSSCRQRAAVYGAVRIRVRMGPQHSLLVGHGELMRRSSGQIKGFVTAGVARQKSVPAQRPIASNKALMQAFTGKDDVFLCLGWFSVILRPALEHFFHLEKSTQLMKDCKVRPVLNAYMTLSVGRDSYRVTPAVLLHDPSFLRSLPHFVAFFPTSKGVRISCSLDPTGQSYAWTPTKAMYDCPKGTLRLLFQLGFSQRLKGDTKVIPA